MAKKKRKPAKEMLPEVREFLVERRKRFLEERRQGLHRGRTPTPEHYRSIWRTSLISERYTPATPEMIAEAEVRLGVVIPALLKEQLLIQNGGYLVAYEPYPFDDASVHWSNATVDGIWPLKSWERAKDDNWFESVEDVEGLDRLIRIAAIRNLSFASIIANRAAAACPA
ncbi:MAG: SMI1/KNR4 family protein [Thermoguttaceae bacterium]